MGILFLTKGDKKVASSRFRVWFVAERLKKQFGHEYKILHGLRYPLWRPSRKRWIILSDLFGNLGNRKYETIFVHKSLFSLDVVLLIVLLKSIYKKRLIFDLDDAEWTHSNLKSVLLARAAHVVFCGSAAIEKWAKAHNKNTRLIPTVIDHEIYARHKVTHLCDGVIRVGWVGFGPSYFRGGHLNVLMDAFISLSDMGKKVVFTVIGSKGDNELKEYFTSRKFQVAIVDELDWSDPEAVPRSLEENSVSIGVAPLIPNKFSNGKCALKIIEYFGCGIPAVASPVGEQAAVLRDGEDGFLASSVDEWVEKINKLNDYNLRVKLSENCLKRVERDYSYKSVIPKIQNELV